MGLGGGGAVHGQYVKLMLRIGMRGDNLHSAVSLQGMGWLMHRDSFDATK